VFIVLLLLSLFISVRSLCCLNYLLLAEFLATVVSFVFLVFSLSDRFLVYFFGP